MKPNGLDDVTQARQDGAKVVDGLGELDRQADLILSPKIFLHQGGVSHAKHVNGEDQAHGEQDGIDLGEDEVSIQDEQSNEVVVQHSKKIRLSIL